MHIKDSPVLTGQSHFCIGGRHLLNARCGSLALGECGLVQVHIQKRRACGVLHPNAKYINGGLQPLDDCAVSVWNRCDTGAQMSSTSSSSNHQTQRWLIKHREAMHYRLQLIWKLLPPINHVLDDFEARC